MLFAYIYVRHEIERMHRFINFIFYQVWCRAPKTRPYSLHHFNANAPLKEVMDSFAYGHTKEGDKFSSRIQAIYEGFADLTRPDIVQFKRWYQSNNDIERICKNAHGSHIVRYAEIESRHLGLCKLLGEFFKNLYSDDLLDLKSLRKKIGKVDEHYKVFMAANNIGKCPFCGITDMLGVYHTKREAYDHYLPKAIYPFNSINFWNLVPACHYCNSSYKTSKDPAFEPKDPTGLTRRRKMFYPYDTTPHSIDITVDIGMLDIDCVQPDNIQIGFGPTELREEIDTWKDVYGIEERYKAKYCDGDAKDWIEQIRILCDLGFRPEDSLEIIRKQTRKAPFANSNFLKIAYLEGCHRAGIFDAL